MAGISRYEKWVLGLTAAFLLATGGWFLIAQERAATPAVTVGQNGIADSSAPEEEKDYPDSLLPGEIIDLNAADAYDLSRLPGIGEKRAADIVVRREEKGPFQSVEELTEISGIGPGTLEKLKDYVTVGSPIK